MKIIPKFFAILRKDGGKTTYRMEPQERELCLKYLSVSFRDGDYIEISIKKKSKRKSRDLERYYWCVVVPMYAESQGCTPSEAHRDLIAECAPIDERGHKITTSDIDFSLAMHCQYVQLCRDHMARDLNIVTPDPERVA